MGWRDGQGGGAMQPQSSLSGFRGGMNPGAGYGGGALGNSGFVPTTGTGQFPEMSLPPALAGTGGVRSPAGPYGPPGFVSGVPQTGGLEPYTPGQSSTTGGVGTTMHPTGIIPPGVPPGTGGIKPPPGSVGTPDMGYLTPDTLMLPNNPAWFSSPQGLQQQLAMARRVMGPYAALAPGRAGQPHERVVPGSGPTEGYTSPNAAMQGMRGAERSAYIEAQRAGQPRTWYQKELAAAGIPWQGMSDYAQMQAWLNTLPPAQRQSYIDAQKAVGLDFTMPAPTGGGTGPFGN